MKNYNYILITSLVFILTSCGISEDCFKGNGSRITQTFPLENFTKIKIYDGVGLVIKEGPNYEVTVKTSDNIIDDLDVRIDGDMLIVKDNSTCNIARDYGQTVVYVTAPNLEEIHSKTDQDIKSDGPLTYPSLKLLSMDLSDGAGTGDFYLTLSTTSQIVIESNNASNFYLSGTCYNINVSFFWGNGIFYGKDLIVSNNIYVFQRGSNNMIFKPTNLIYGDIYGIGNVVLRSNPLQNNIIQHFTGTVIYQTD